MCLRLRMTLCYVLQRDRNIIYDHTIPQLKHSDERLASSHLSAVTMANLIAKHNTISISKQCTDTYNNYAMMNIG